MVKFNHEVQRLLHKILFNNNNNKTADVYRVMTAYVSIPCSLHLLYMDYHIQSSESLCEVNTIIIPIL